MASKCGVRPPPPVVRPGARACSAWTSAKCAPDEPGFGPATPAESSLSVTLAATRARSRSPSLRASTGVAAAMTAVTKPLAVRTTRASSGAAAATAARSFPAAAGWRLANAIARYRASLVLAPLNEKSLPVWEAFGSFACSVRLGPFASQRLSAHPNKEGERDEDDDRL